MKIVPIDGSRAEKGRTLHFLLSPVLLVLFLATLAQSQAPLYRTFSQTSLAEKKAKAGKAYGSDVCFTFHNLTGSSSVDGLHIKLNAHVSAILDSGGFPGVTLDSKGKVLTLTGLLVNHLDSVTICLRTDKKAPGTLASNWWWTVSGSQYGVKEKDLLPVSDVQLLTEPNGGNVLEHLYKRVIARPPGVVLGVAQPDSLKKLFGWVRFKSAQRKAFAHVGDPRCFDFIVNGNGSQKPFVKELSNPHVKKHDNHLLGELHALKLAIIANDSGVTEPLDSGVTLFGDLVYQDSVNPGDACNGLTIRQIAHLADSALTYCANFDSIDYVDLDACISRINDAFDGPIVALSFDPFVIAGSGWAYFLKPNPSAYASTRRNQGYAYEDSDLPEEFRVGQNYPNPFNPTTTISMTIPTDAFVTVEIYNLLGQLVATPLRSSYVSAGEESVEFDASALPSGVYVYRVRSETSQGAIQVVTRKMMLLK